MCVRTVLAYARARMYLYAKLVCVCRCTCLVNFVCFWALPIEIENKFMKLMSLLTFYRPYFLNFIQVILFIIIMQCCAFRSLMIMNFGAVYVGQAFAYIQDFNKAKMAANRLFALFLRQPKIDNNSTEGIPPVCKFKLMEK